MIIWLFFMHFKQSGNLQKGVNFSLLKMKYLQIVKSLCKISKNLMNAHFYTINFGSKYNVTKGVNNFADERK